MKFTLGWLTYAMSVLMALTAIAIFILAFRQPQRHYVADDTL